MYVIEKKCYNQ